jgi:predicted transposase/invertase (TIGR01784 family)
MFSEEKAKDIVMEHIKIVRQKADTVLTDKWEAVTVELPKFKKTEDELETVVDKWIYSLKNMEKLPERPEKLNEKIFDELYENAKINRLKTEDMKAYGKSVLEYDDVISSLRFVEERARRETREETREETRKEDRIEFVRNCHKYSMDIEQIAALTGLTEKEVSDIIAKLWKLMDMSKFKKQKIYIRIRTALMETSQANHSGKPFPELSAVWTGKSPAF